MSCSSRGGGTDINWRVHFLFISFYLFIQGKVINCSYILLSKLPCTKKKVNPKKLHLTNNRLVRPKVKVEHYRPGQLNG